MSEEQPEPQGPHPRYDPQGPYPNYAPQYQPMFNNIWDKPIIILWLVISGVLILASVIGVIVIHADEITIERVLIAMLALGSASIVVFIFYWLAFEDFNG